MNHSRIVSVPLVCIVATVLACPCCTGAEPLRIWVDVNGQFAVEARLVTADEKNVVLLRKDGGDVTVPIDQLSDRDKEYLDEYEERLSQAENPLRVAPPDPPQFDPQPVLDLPVARHVAPSGSPIRLDPPTPLDIPTEVPGKLTADPAPWSFAVNQGRLTIYPIDAYDQCSRPIPVTITSESGSIRTSIAMSISSGLTIAGQKARHHLVRFDVESQNAYVSLEHDKSIKLLDHHAGSNRSLVLVGHNTLGKGGELAIATGWGPHGITLSHHRSLGQTTGVSAPHVRWARWIDDEHVLAVIDQTLGLWNLISGERVYRVDGIELRAIPAISGGRRYVAVPYRGSVVLLSSMTGEPLGRIGVETQVPGVSFSPFGNALAIATTRRMRIWDLTSGTLSSEIQSRQSLGSRPPIWVDSDLLLSSSGMLLSAFRGIPIWKYDVSTAHVISVGEHVAVFRKHPTSELATISLPHEGATDALEWIDSNSPAVDPAGRRVVGRSKWDQGRWADEDVQVSRLPARFR